jgi:membrane protease YdiL (CAAX protease family)
VSEPRARRAEHGRVESLANPFGLGAALVGFAAGVACGTIAVSIYATESGHPGHPATFGANVASLLGLWVGLVGAVLLASRSGSGPRRLAARLAEDYGLALRPWPDLAIGVAVGLGAQYLLVPLLELPLLPFVPHLFDRLGEPARGLTGGADTVRLVALGLLVCLGSPIVEELFFRGLLLRGLLGVFRTRRFAPALSVTLSAVAFGLAHFEALQLIGLTGFGLLLGLLAYRTGRLGPGIVAHVVFNTATFVSIALAH